MKVILIKNKMENVNLRNPCSSLRVWLVPIVRVQ